MKSKTGQKAKLQELMSQGADDRKGCSNFKCRVIPLAIMMMKMLVEEEKATLNIESFSC